MAKCYICKREDGLLNKSIILKTGIFSKEFLDICAKCSTLLDEKYGKTELKLLSKASGKKLYSSSWHKKKNHKYLNHFVGKIIDDISNPESLHKELVKIEQGLKELKKVEDDKFKRLTNKHTNDIIIYLHSAGEFYDAKKGAIYPALKDGSPSFEDQIEFSEIDNDWNDWFSSLTTTDSFNLKKALKKVEKLLKNKITKLLKEKAVKMPASDIDAFLKYQNVEKVKALCEKMYHNGEISRTANYRYFMLSEEKGEPKKASVSKSESTDIPEQIKKLSDLKDQGILTEEEFQSKKKDLLDKM